MKELQEKIYDKSPNQTDYEFGRDVRIKIIHNMIGNPKNKKILDIGCWTGDIIQPYICNNSCFGIDTSEKALEIAENCGIKTYKLNFETDDFPFQKEFFDIILCSEVLEHLINQDRILKKIHSILKKDGTFICTIPNINTPVSWFIQIFLDLPPKNSARYKSVHYRDFTYKIAKKMLELNSFEIIKTHGTFIFPLKNYISQKLANFFPRLSENFIFACKKSKFSSPVTPEIVFNIRELFRK